MYHSRCDRPFRKRSLYRGLLSPRLSPDCPPPRNFLAACAARPAIHVVSLVALSRMSRPPRSSAIGCLDSRTGWVEDRLRRLFGRTQESLFVDQAIDVSGTPFLLAAPGGNDAFTDLRGSFAGPFGRELAKLDRRYFHMNVDPVQQRAGNPVQIILNLARRVVGRAEWALRDEGLAGRQQADDAVNLGRFKRLVQRQRRQNRRQPFGEHQLACTRRTDEQDVVAARRGDFQRALDGLLALDIGEIEF